MDASLSAILGGPVSLSPRRVWSAERGGLVDAQSFAPPSESPTRSPRGSPVHSRRGSSSSTSAYGGGGGGSPRGGRSSPLSDEFREPQVSPTSPRSGVLGEKASSERGTALASGGLGQMAKQPQSYEAFHRKYAGAAAGSLEGTPGGDTFNLVEEADAASRAARSRPTTTSGYTMPGGTVVGTVKSKSTFHHITRVTTGASFLDAGIHRTSFLILQDERKLAQAAHRDAAGLPPPATRERHLTSASLSEQHHPS